MAKKKASKQKKMNVRVDFTPMVDMMMLLITFFMLCTSLSKPQTMQLTMPSNDKNIDDQNKNASKASQTITIYACADDKIAYIEGIPEYDNPACLKMTTWGSKGIRDVLINHLTEEGIAPVAKILDAKHKLEAEKKKNPKKYEGEKGEKLYQEELSKIKGGEINGEKIPTMTIVIKPTDGASYKNVVDVLDEMQICSIGKYVIDKINDDDLKLLGSKGLK